MRRHDRLLAIAAALAVFFFWSGCANRGMATPSDAGGTPSAGGARGARGGNGGAAPDPGADGAADAGVDGAGGAMSGPVLKVDFDMQGRPSTEVTELGYLAWPVLTAASISNTFQGVQFTFALAGTNGTALTSDWYKAGVDAPNYARLVGDGLTVEGGEAGAQIQMTIHGLTAGAHTLLVYLNQTSNADATMFAPVDILVGGVVVASRVQPTARALTTATAQTASLFLTAQAGQGVVVLFRANTTTGAADANVMINGFELDTPNMAKQATSPSPADADEHVDAAGAACP